MRRLDFASFSKGKKLLWLLLLSRVRFDWNGRAGGEDDAADKKAGACSFCGLAIRFDISADSPKRTSASSSVSKLNVICLLFLMLFEEADAEEEGPDAAE